MGSDMMASTGKLSAQATRILTAIAEGHTYEQILAMDSALVYPDIFAAASEALHIAGLQPTTPSGQVRARTSLSEHRKVHPRAYERWLPDEETQLLEYVRAGWEISKIAATLERQPSAIRSRLIRLGVLPADSDEETNESGASGQDER